MGAPIGYFANQQPVDYPDLNKCPDCETFFQSDTCPLCGKVCPEEFRAGNRKTVKQKKIKYSHSSGRVEFVPWYYSGWFITAMLVVFPILGLILLWQSNAEKGWKIGGTLLPVVLHIAPTLIGILMGMLSFSSMPEPPVESREEYVAMCEAIDAEDYYRSSNEMVGQHVTMNLTVKRKILDETGSLGPVTVFYECEAQVGNQRFPILLADCRREDLSNLTTGDKITVWGETYGGWSVYSSAVGVVEEPTVLMYYVALSS